MQLIPRGKCPTCSQIMREPYMLRKDSDYEEIRLCVVKKDARSLIGKTHNR